MILTPSITSDILLIAIVLLFAGHVWYLKRKRRWFILDPLNFFWVGVFVIYVIEAISSYEGYVSYFGEFTVTYTLLWIFFGLVFLNFGYYLKAGKHER